MKLDLGSFAFGSSITTGGGTPSWGTALGQGKGLKFTYPGWDNIMSGVLYKSVPTSKIYMPIGKGGHIYSGLEDEGIQFAALFDNVYINEVRVNAPFILVVYRDSSTSWEGRRTLKYSDKIEYRESPAKIYRNCDFIPAAREALQIDEKACWIVSDLYVEDQDTLHLFAGIVDAHNNQTFASSEQRKAAWLESIESTLSESSFYKKYCSDSIINTKMTLSMKENSYLQQIYYGAPGTGKSYKIDRQTTDNNSIRTTFHPDTDYATFVGAYKPMMDTVDEYALDATGKTHQVIYPNDKKSIVYKFEPQVFLKAYVEAWKRYLNKQEGEDDSYFLVIEEINRGNCAQIFGDLFQLLDREDSGYSSYAISPESSITKYLAEEAQSADGTKFSDLVFSDVIKKRKDGVTKIIATADDLKAGKRLVLPPNLHIWATMNTSDQSLFPIDSAFKRRWDWKYMPIKRADKEPEKKWIINVAHDGKTYWCYWWEFLEAINHQIEETTHSEDKQLGYFFAKPKAGENFISTDTFVNKVIFYLWNDVFKDEDSAVFQYDNDKVEDVSINRSGTMYFRHFMENTDEMIHYFINQLFAMGKESTPVVPIDYLKNDANSNVIEYLPKMREDSDENPMPNLENKDEIKEEEVGEIDKDVYTYPEYAQIFDRVDSELQTVGCERIANAGNSIDYKLKGIPSSICCVSARLNKAKNDAYGEVLLWMNTNKTEPEKSKKLRDEIASQTEGVFKTFKSGNVTLRTLEKDPTSIESINRGWVLKNPDIKFTDDSLNDEVKWIYETMKGLLDKLQPIIAAALQ